jgi:hypothetical protein
MIINVVYFFNGPVCSLLWRWRPVRKMLEEILMSEFSDKQIVNSVELTTWNQQ